LTRPGSPALTTAILSFATLAALGLTVLVVVGVRRRPRLDDRRAFLLLFLAVAIVRGFVALFVSLELVGPHVDRLRPLGIAFLAGGWLLIDSLLVGVIIWLGNFSALGRQVIPFHRVGRVLRTIDGATNHVVPRLVLPFQVVARWAGFRAAGSPGPPPRLPIGRAAVFWLAWIAVVMTSLAALVSKYGVKADSWIVLSNGALLSFMIGASGYQGYMKRTSWARVAGTMWFAALGIYGLRVVPRDVSAWPAAGLFTGVATAAFAAFVIPAWFRARHAESEGPAPQDSAT
jgi:hypothetical protein